MTESPTAGSLAELEADGGGILAPGIYPEDYGFTKPVDWKRSPGAILTGQIKWKPGSEESIARGAVKFDCLRQGPNIHAAYVKIQKCEITNRHSDIGLVVDGWMDGPKPVGVEIRRNWIHGIGKLPRTNYCHGIYFKAQQGLIANNWIEDCADRAVQLYSNERSDLPADVRVNCNVMRRCGSGVVFNGTRNDVVANHIEDCLDWLAFPGGDASGPLVGPGNSLRYNALLPTNGKANLGVQSHPNIEEVSNVRAPAAKTQADFDAWNADRLGGAE